MAKYPVSKKRLAQAIEEATAKGKAGAKYTPDETEELNVAVASLQTSEFEAPEDWSDFFAYCGQHFVDVSYLSMVAISSRLMKAYSRARDIVKETAIKNYGEETAKAKLATLRNKWDGTPNTYSMIPSPQEWEQSIIPQLRAVGDHLIVTPNAVGGYFIEVPFRLEGMQYNALSPRLGWLALGHNSSNPSLLSVTKSMTQREAEELREQQNKEFLRILNDILGTSLTDVTQPIDVEIALSSKDLLDSAFVPKEALLEDYEEEDVTTTLSYIYSIRIVASPIAATSYESSASYRAYNNATGESVLISSLEQAKSLDPKEFDDVEGIVRKFESSLLDYTRDRNITLYARLQITKKAAQYMCQSEYPRPSDVYQWAKAVHNYSYSANDPMVEISKPLSEVRKLAKQLPVRPRVNEDNLCINEDGDILYIPPTDEDVLDRYDNELEQTLDETETVGGYCLRSPYLPTANRRPAGMERGTEPPPLKNLPVNRILMVDWALNRLAYTNTLGDIQTFDMNSWRKATPKAIYATLNLNPLTDKNVGELLKHINVFSHTQGKSLGDYIQQEDFSYLFDLGIFEPQISQRYYDNNVQTAKSRANSIIEYISRVMTGAHVIARTLERENTELPEVIELLTDSQNMKLLDFSIDSKIGPLRCIGRMIKDISEKMMEDTGALFATGAIKKAMSHIGIFVVVSKYLENKNEIKALAEKELEGYRRATAVDIDDKYQPEPLPFITDDFSYLPHQLKADYATSADPENGVYHVDAGGGKTPMLLADAFKTMNRAISNKTLGGRRRPLLLCPGNLIKNYVEDAIFMTGGRVNIIIVNTSTMNQHGEEVLERMIVDAPINTLVISEYDFMRNRAFSFPYGTQPIEISLNCEFMRRFDWVFVSQDESQFLRNMDSKRSYFVNRLVSDAERRRIATGTFIHGMLQDAAGQFAQIDPTVFGSTDKFINEYGEQIYRGKVVEWREGAALEVGQKVRDNSAYIRGARKEWAALLPSSIEEFHRLDLTQQQRDVYDALLKMAIEEIKKNPQLMEKLKSGREEDAAMIEMLLRPYLQRMEKFLAAPDRDTLSVSLPDADKVSPKAKKVAELFYKHINGYKSISGDSQAPNTGKVLVFTSYIASAESIYNSLPDDLKAKTMLYYAADGVKATKRFEKDSKYQFLIGTEPSLNTGHNFQFVTRLIRVENVWNPGDVEQAASRLNRPDPKQLFAERSKIYFDWLIVDKTIDVTKTARLVSKMLESVRFNEQYNPLFANIPSLPLVSMTLSSILNDNDFGSASDPGSLWEYLEAYQKVAVARRKDYAEFQSTYKGPRKPVPVKSLGMPYGSKLINVPYVDNMELPMQDELGIQSMNQYLTDKGLEVEVVDLKGMRVHTEYGDGEVVSQSKYKITVELDGGGKKSVNKLSAFIILKPSKTPVRQRLAKLLELPSQFIPLEPLEEDDELDVEDDEDVVEHPVEDTVDDESLLDDGGSAEEVDTPKVEKKKRVSRAPKVVDRKLNGKMYGSVYVVNNMIALLFDEDDPDMQNVKDATLKRLGFRHSGAFIDAYIPTYRAMTRFLDALEDNFDIADKYMKPLRDLEEAFQNGKKRLLNVQMTTQVDIRNFYLDARRMVPKGELRPYPIINEGNLYITFALDKQPSAKQVPNKIKVPTVKFEREMDGYYIALYSKRSQFKAALKLFEANGIEIVNKDELLEEIKELKIFNVNKNKDE